MNLINKIGLGLLTIASAFMLSGRSASADDFSLGLRFGMGGHFMDKEVRQEMHKQMVNRHNEFKSMTREQGMQKLEVLWQERETRRQKQDTARQEFTDLTRKQLEERRDNGETLGQILQSRGKSTAETQAFVETQGYKKVDSLTQKFSLTAETVQIMRDDLVVWAKRVVNRWFGSN